MKKIILNKDYGGFGLSYAAYKLYAKKKGIDLFVYERAGAKDGYYDYHDFVYKKVDKPSNDLFVCYTNKDFGDIVVLSGDEDLSNLIKDFYETYSVNLNRDMRADPTLIEVVEELGSAADGWAAKLKIVEIPDEVAADYEIDDYDGFETIHQKIQKW